MTREEVLTMTDNTSALADSCGHVAPAAEPAGYLSALAVAIDHFGLDAFSSVVTDLAHRARDVAPAAACVLGDPSQPLAARERAFALVSMALTLDTPGS